MLFSFIGRGPDMNDIQSSTYSKVTAEGRALCGEGVKVGLVGTDETDERQETN